MSIQITFQLVMVKRNLMMEYEHSHPFLLEIFNKEHKQSMKTHFHSIQNGWVNLPENIFVLPMKEALEIKIQEVSQRKEAFGHTKSVGQYIFDLSQISTQKDTIKESTITFHTDDKHFQILITYKLINVENKIFAGHFYGCLSNQGSKSLSLIDMKYDEKHHQSWTGRQFQKQAPVTIATQNQSTSKKSEKSWRHWINICNQANVDKDLSYFQQPKSQTKMKENKKLSDNVNFYKGPCKTRNIFSCIDANVDDTEIHIIEPKYK